MHGAVVRSRMLDNKEKGKKNLLRRTEMRMLRWILEVSLKGKIRNDEIRRKCGVVCIGKKIKEARLRWHGHVMRRGREEPIRSIMGLNIEGNRGRGRPKKKKKNNNNNNNDNNNNNNDNNNNNNKEIQLLRDESPSKYF